MDTGRARTSTRDANCETAEYDGGDAAIPPATTPKSRKAPLAVPRSHSEKSGHQEKSGLTPNNNCQSTFVRLSFCRWSIVASLKYRRNRCGPRATPLADNGSFAQRLEAAISRSGKTIEVLAMRALPLPASLCEPDGHAS